MPKIHTTYELLLMIFVALRWLPPKRLGLLQSIVSVSIVHGAHDNLVSEAKLNGICTDLDLRAGERFLDIGCGGGALLITAAASYGVSATGCTLSLNQYELATAEIKEAGPLRTRDGTEQRLSRPLGTFSEDCIGGHVRACRPASTGRLLPQG